MGQKLKKMIKNLIKSNKIVTKLKRINHNQVDFR